jgi:hypothetical protein
MLYSLAKGFYNRFSISYLQLVNFYTQLHTIFTLVVSFVKIM